MLPFRHHNSHVRKRVKVRGPASLPGTLTEHFVVDQELSAKVESELRIENETRDSESLPANIQEFLDNSAFEV